MLNNPNAQVKRTSYANYGGIPQLFKDSIQYCLSGRVCIHHTLLGTCRAQSTRHCEHKDIESARAPSSFNYSSCSMTSSSPAFGHFSCSEAKKLKPFRYSPTVLKLSRARLPHPGDITEPTTRASLTRAAHW